MKQWRPSRGNAHSLISGGRHRVQAVSEERRGIAGGGTRHRSGKISASEITSKSAHSPRVTLRKRLKLEPRNNVHLAARRSYNREISAAKL